MRCHYFTTLLLACILLSQPCWSMPEAQTNKENGNIALLSRTKSYSQNPKSRKKQRILKEKPNSRKSSSSKSSSPDKKYTSKKKAASIETLQTEIGNIEELIRNAHQLADFKLILEAKRVFEKIEAKEETWQEFIQKRDVYQWPFQDSHQAVAGHLFFPPDEHLEIMDWLNGPALWENRIGRSDWIWSFAVAAHYRDPSGKYYLYKTYHLLREDIYQEGIENLKNEALHAFEQYIKEHTEGYLWEEAKLMLSDRNHIEEVAYLEEMGTHRSRAQALTIREIPHFQSDFEGGPPTEIDYLEIARKGYLPAYLKALRAAKSTAKKIQVLEEAVEKEYLPAYPFLAHRLWKADRQRSIKLYETAGQQGYAEAYLGLGDRYRGKLPDGLNKWSYSELLSRQSQEDQEKMLRYYKLAAKGGCIRAHDNLVRIYAYFYDQTDDKDADAYFEETLWPILLRGLRVGSREAYYVTDGYVRDQKEMEKVEKSNPSTAFTLWQEVYDYMIK